MKIYTKAGLKGQSYKFFKSDFLGLWCTLRSEAFKAGDFIKVSEEVNGIFFDTSVC